MISVAILIVVKMLAMVLLVGQKHALHMQKQRKGEEEIAASYTPSIPVLSLITLIAPANYSIQLTLGA